MSLYRLLAFPTANADGFASTAYNQEFVISILMRP
jgi:hypothetical protein